MLTLALFVEITVRVLAKDGLDSYLPTIVFVENREIIIVNGISAGVDHTKALKDAIDKHASTGSAYMFGVRSGSGEVIAGHCILKDCDFVLIRNTGSGFHASQTVEPVWWNARP